MDVAAQLASPDPGRVHHSAGAHRDRRAGERVDRGGTVAVDGDGPAAGDYPRAMPGRCPCDRDDQARVVDELTVPGQQPAAQVDGPQRRHQGLGLDRAQPPGAGQDRAGGAGAEPDQVGDVQAGIGDEGGGGGEADRQREHHR